MARSRAGRRPRVPFAPRLVIMAKRPVAGAVKQRLARDIGTVAATRVYRMTLAHTVRRLSADPRWRTYLAVTPDAALADACWPDTANVTRISQGPGDLGARMQRLLDCLPPGPVVVVGSDIPAIQPAHIAQAFKLLGQADVVFGPAKDGGFWLIGQKKSPRPQALFENVPWSTEQTLAATLANLEGEIFALAQELTDIDQEKDLARHLTSAERLVPYRRQTI